MPVNTFSHSHSVSGRMQDRALPLTDTISRNRTRRASMTQHEQIIAELRAEVELLTRQLADRTPSPQIIAFEHCDYGIAVGDPITGRIIA